MVAGLERGQVDGFPGWRASLTWMLIILAETLHGMVREIFIAPVLGDLRARQLGVFVGCALVFVIAWLTARWLGAHSRRTQLQVGAFWGCMTLAFEFALGRALGTSWQRILEDYNPARGGFMILGMAVLFLAPMLAARWRR
jgi:peptidoglycan/LPS O-acetylase OafA/YrhL